MLLSRNITGSVPERSHGGCSCKLTSVQTSPQSTRGSRSTLTGPLVHSGACTPGLFCISYTFWFPQGEGSASSQSTLVMARHSKLQKQVLALYRQFLQAGRDKPGFVPRIREEFRVNARIKKTDVMHIEYLYRRGQRQLEQLRDSNTKQLGSFSNPANQS